MKAAPESPTADTISYCQSTWLSDQPLLLNMMLEKSWANSVMELLCPRIGSSDNFHGRAHSWAANWMREISQILPCGVHTRASYILRINWSIRIQYKDELPKMVIFFNDIENFTFWSHAPKASKLKPSSSATKTRRWFSGLFQYFTNNWIQEASSIIRPGHSLIKDENGLLSMCWC